LHLFFKSYNVITDIVITDKGVGNMIMSTIFVGGYVGLQALKAMGRLLYHFARMLYVC
jgi:hypothetical protein